VIEEKDNEVEELVDGDGEVGWYIARYEGLEQL